MVASIGCNSAQFAIDLHQIMPTIAIMAATSIRLDGDLCDLLDRIASKEERTKRAVVNRALRLYASASMQSFVDSRHANNPVDDTALEVGSLDIPPASVAAELGDLRHAG